MGYVDRDKHSSDRADDANGENAHVAPRHICDTRPQRREDSDDEAACRQCRPSLQVAPNARVDEPQGHEGIHHGERT
eukprot:7128298-Prymnesium_polylepis.1